MLFSSGIFLLPLLGGVCKCEENVVGLDEVVGERSLILLFVTFPVDFLSWYFEDVLC